MWQWPLRPQKSKNVLATEERLAKIEQADIAAIKNKDGTYSFVLGYIIAE